LKGEFSKNIITLFSGNGLGQMFNLIGTLFVYTQFYTATQFGYLAIYMSIASILSVIATARYEQAVVLPKEKIDGFHVLILSLIAVIVFSLFIFIILVLVISFYPDLIYINELGDISYLIPFSVLFYGSYQSINFWMIRNKNYKTISLSKMLEGASVFLVTSLLGVLFSYKFGLIIGFVSGQLVSFAILFGYFLKGSHADLKLIDLGKVKSMAIQYIDFPKFNLPQVFIDMFQKYGSVFIIERFFGYSVLGNYHLVYRVLRGPVGLVGMAFSQVFYQKISEYYSSGKDFYGLLKQSVYGLSLYSIPFFALIFFIVPVVFDAILGPGYEESGVIAQIL
jgi:O-antigen/teichoic acid export membrane protein